MVAMGFETNLGRIVCKVVLEQQFAAIAGFHNSMSVAKNENNTY